MIGMTVWFRDDDGSIEADTVVGYNSAEDTVLLGDTNEEKGIEDVYLTESQVPVQPVAPVGDFYADEDDEEKGITFNEALDRPSLYRDTGDDSFYLLVVGSELGEAENVALLWPEDGCGVFRATKGDFTSDTRFVDVEDCPASLEFFSVNG